MHKRHSNINTLKEEADFSHQVGLHVLWQIAGATLRFRGNTKEVCSSNFNFHKKILLVEREHF
jgi:hypothetical protein